MIETFSFTIPSIQDDTPLDCRIYHPEDLDNANHQWSGAIIAHPYAPLGGSQDDHVVLALTECLLEAGHVVLTFNFRGAGGSAGKGSWTGHGEVQDYISVFGLLMYYLHHLSLSSSWKVKEALLSPMQTNQIANFSQADSDRLRDQSSRPTNILLGGYSFGSLILVRLPSVTDMINTFETAEHGTAGAEIFLRARALARQTLRTWQDSQPPSISSSRKHRSSNSHSRSSPITVGGEETDPSERRRSKDSHRRSVSAVRELPHRIKAHVRRHSGSGQHRRSASEDHQMLNHIPSSPQRAPQVAVRYFLISPVLFPLSTTLVPPGLAFPKAHTAAGNAGVLSLKSPTFVAYGDSDHFTSAKKLRQWAERLASESGGRLKWSQIDGAGHFWREESAAARLEAQLIEWTKTAV